MLEQQVAGGRPVAVRGVVGGDGVRRQARPVEESCEDLDEKCACYLKNNDKTLEGF